MRIAIIGAGGAGLTSAWLLDGIHDVTLYEKEDRLGGHAHTITVDAEGEQIALDAGFEFFSNIMFPTYMRLLSLLNVPLRPFPMTVTQYDTRTGYDYLLPPFHGFRLFPEGLTPRKIVDMLRFQWVMKSSATIMNNRDVSVTTQEFLDSLGIPEDFKYGFMYPFLQASWGVSLDEIKTFIVYDAFRYAYLNTPGTLIPHGWNEIEGGTQTYVNAVRESLKKVRVKTGTGIKSLRQMEQGYLVEESTGQTETYDHIILATNANQAAAIIANVPGTEDVRRLLNQITYFETTIALHGDIRLMPPNRKHWSTVNTRFDGVYSQYSMWKPWKSKTPVFKSWVTHEPQLPDKLYAVAKYLHPLVDANYFGAQKQLQSYQGQHNLWLAGMYMHDVDCHESAVVSGVNVVQALAPDSVRLKQITGLG